MIPEKYTFLNTIDHFEVKLDTIAFCLKANLTDEESNKLEQDGELFYNQTYSSGIKQELLFIEGMRCHDFRCRNSHIKSKPEYLIPVDYLLIFTSIQCKIYIGEQSYA